MPSSDRPSAADQDPREHQPDADQTVRLQRLGEAMDAFLQLGPERDAATVARFLARHDALRDLLEPMLAAEQDPGPNDDDDGDRASAELTPGRCIDDYRIVRLIGRGGMGTVYEAEQTSLRRRVALKVLHGHLSWSASSIERFRREASAASRLRHPAIVPIHEIGEWRGLHWFSMEFVDGRPLHEVMHDERLGVRGDCSRAAEVAELVARVADALQHAHDHGFVHRDVKPHNIMIGVDGSVRLLDFGLAKHLATDARSRTGDFIGTPHYCSPEQVAIGGSIGPRSDVFSLGIVLYELLARRRPFDGETARAVMLSIEHGAFEPLHRTARSVPRDLQVICHKALETAPRDRYASAGEFAADLRRFLRIEPILAEPPGPLRRAAKWVRRHRTRAALWFVGSLLLLGAPIGYALHVENARVLVERERALLDLAEGIAFEGIERTIALLAEQLDRQPAPGVLPTAHLAAVVAQCEQFLALRADDPRRTNRVARSFHTIAGIYAQLGHLDPALAACERARTILESARDRLEPSLVAANEGRLLRRELHIRQLKDPSEAEEVFERAIAHWRSLAENGLAGIDVVLDYGATLLVRARALANQPARRAEAERLVDRVLAITSGHDLAEQPRAETMAVQARVVLAHLHLWAGRTKQALELFESTRDRIDQLPASQILAFEKALVLAGMGQALQRVRRPSDAERSLRDAIGAASSLAQEFAGSQQLHRALLQSRLRLGSVLLVQGKAEEAENVLRETAGLVASRPPSTRDGWLDRAVAADIHAQLANCILVRHRGSAASDEAAELFRSAVALLEGLVAEQPDDLSHRQDLGAALHGLAALANQRGESTDAATLAERAIRCQEDVLRAAPEAAEARFRSGMHHGQLALALAGCRRHAELPAVVQRVLSEAPRHAPTLRLAAEAAAIAAADPGPGADTERLGDLAVAVLERVADVDPKEARRLVANRRFAVLRGREDFERLVGRLGAR